MTDIDAGLVQALIADQFPEWADLPVRPVPRQGWDNRTFRLGEELSVRLPSAEGYVAAVVKEDRWLPFLARELRTPVPAPVAVGRPASAYPFPWSVRRWLPGDTVESGAVDRVQLTRDLGDFLHRLRDVPAEDGPVAGRHSWYRGCHPSVYGDQVAESLVTLADAVDVSACREVWSEAMGSVWGSTPVWFHGDVSAGNLLVRDGKLAAVIDFGTCGTGDPACDLVIAWTYFEGVEREVFREAVGLPDEVWRRARGWALWKALAVLAGLSSPDVDGVQRRVLETVLADSV
ncbi:MULTISPECIES: aminoglycoside phosphotransferase family protein [unclassified Streptomyces]|uniref:aminoglycoside phosphotransferase family protein n=1 Tax=unclassified Streptomyces TaxID=2593676 RepID=UPI000DD7BA09|nr:MULTISPECIES: aminoglycoside phosphotransferase family protein [unclassified Streptomyces]QZZ25906.1 aminoglycoside phosphotransferase family protein [Streptomyces sp. ST1015]